MSNFLQPSFMKRIRSAFGLAVCLIIAIPSAALAQGISEDLLVTQGTVDAINVERGTLVIEDIEFSLARTVNVNGTQLSSGQILDRLSGGVSVSVRSGWGDSVADRSIHEITILEAR